MSFLNSTSTQKSTILITGGGTGIGLALAQRLIALGHTVIAAGRKQAALDEAKAANPKLETVQGDVSSDAGRIALFKKVIKEFPEVNVLINNAGTSGSGTPFKDTTSADWEQHKELFNINVLGPIHLSILFAPHLITKPNAMIANNSSLVAFVTYAPLASYSASKGDQFIILTSAIVYFFLQLLCTPSRSLFVTS
jgi:uncharacterized oxidoreductase